MLEEVLIPRGVRTLPLDPQLAAAAAERNRQPQLDQISVALAKQRFVAARMPSAAAMADGVVTEERTVPGLAGPIPVRLYRDAAMAGQLPILIYFHGGGFVLGNPDTHDVVCRSYARGRRLLVVSVDYRLAPEHPYPAAVDDAWSALVHMAKEGAGFGGDPGRIAIGGDSAGGLLTVATALRARAAGGPTIKAIVPFYPMMDLVKVGGYASYDAYGDGSVGLTTRDVRWFVELYCPPERRSEVPASPTFADDYAGLPPAFIVLAEHDVLFDEGHDFALRLVGSGTQVTLVRVAGTNHGFMSSDLGLESVAAVYKLAGDWLDRHLAA